MNKCNTRTVDCAWKIAGNLDLFYDYIQK